MRLWLSKNSEVPLREQLVTQIILGVVSNDLKVKQRLPSTRDLARRYNIHANTVSAAYRELAARGWVEFRKGSGVYVRAQVDKKLEHKLDLDQLVARFLRSIREQGHSLAEIKSSLDRCLGLQAPDHFLLIEPDVELRNILLVEIGGVTSLRITASGLDELQDQSILTGAVPVVMPGHAEQVRATLKPDSDLLVLRSESVAGSMQGQQRPPHDALVAVVSRWPDFLRWSRTILVAAGLDADALSFRDARQRGWEKGLRSAAFVITDSLMAEKMPANCQVKVFRLIADASLNEIAEYADKYF
jgi:GntR family transcriptional regulator